MFNGDRRRIEERSRDSGQSEAYAVSFYEMTYKEFLETKIELATESGFIVDPEKVNKALKPHQCDAVMWALRGGRRALFESFGLGKTVQEIEFCHMAAEHSGGRALIVLPLGVKQEFTRDNEIEIAADDFEEEKDVIKNLQSYLKVQRRIFAEAA